LRDSFGARADRVQGHRAQGVVKRDMLDALALVASVAS